MKTRIWILVMFAVVLGGCASTAKPTQATNTSGCPMALSVTAADGAKTLCVAVGGTVTVDLTEATGPWLPLEVSGGVLSATPAGSAAPQVRGPQNATYTAKETGTAQIMSSHPACPQSPGMISCHAIAVWKVTVQVKS